MATSTVEMKQYACDAPECDRTKSVELESAPPIGWYEGKVTHVASEGYDVTTTWVACQRTHVGKAVQAMVDEALDGINPSLQGKDTEPGLEERYEEQDDKIEVRTPLPHQHPSTYIHTEA